jgi:hypothetical protein
MRFGLSVLSADQAHASGIFLSVPNGFGFAAELFEIGQWRSLKYRHLESARGDTIFLCLTSNSSCTAPG